MNPNRVTLHIGLHKTGTTYLQEYIFPKLDGVFYSIGWRAFRNVFRAQAGQKILISDEGISGNFKGGNWLGEFHKNLQIIQDLCNDPKIILGFRAHEKFLSSVYKQYLHEGGTEGFETVFNKENTGRIKIEEMYFLPRINAVQEKFSEVFFYCQEDIQKNFGGFTTGLCDFLEIEQQDPAKFSSQTINVGVRSKDQVNRLIRLNKFAAKLKKLPGKPNWYGRVFQKLKLTPRHICQDYMKSTGQAWEMDAEILQFIRDTYQQDWEETKKAISYSK